MGFLQHAWVHGLSLFASGLCTQYRSHVFSRRYHLRGSQCRHGSRKTSGRFRKRQVWPVQGRSLFYLLLRLHYLRGMDPVTVVWSHDLLRFDQWAYSRSFLADRNAAVHGGRRAEGIAVAACHNVGIRYPANHLFRGYHPGNQTAKLGT